MEKKTASAITLTLLLTGMLTLAFNIQPVSASGTVYIRADGSIDPPTAPISTVDNVTYTLTGNISGDNGIVVERSNIIIDGAGYTLQGTGNGFHGFRLLCITNVTIRNTNIKNFFNGIWLDSSSNIAISGNNITNNRGDGISLSYSSNNSIVENNITANNQNGIGLSYYSNNNSVAENNITANKWDGIWLSISSNNTITGNNIIANTNYGISLYYSSHNSIFGNNIANNGHGISVWAGIGLLESSNNTFYHNNFIDNAKQVYDYSWDYPKFSSSVNIWDDGFPSGGNYWSDYAGVDVKSGPNQDLPGSDCIGDTPYIIDADNVDHYPLMNPYGTPPPPAYSLTITATVGGTTDPAAGTYGYTANSTVQVTALPNTNYLFDYWELDSVNVGSANPYSVYMDKDHTLKAVFSPIPPPLSVSITPLSASILVGQSVTFTSTISGGYSPYNYQWYLNGNPVSGANSTSWAFMPTASGIYYVHLKVTDAKANTAQSDTARIAVATVPVGGYSFSIQVQTKTEPVIPYIALIAILTAIFTKLKPKTKRKR